MTLTVSEQTPAKGSVSVRVDYMHTALMLPWRPIALAFAYSVTLLCLCMIFDTYYTVKWNEWKIKLGKVLFIYFLES